MPTYSYRCKDCGHEYEAFQSMKADPDTVCPECKGTVERLIGAGAGIVFKGSGFYVTDYRKDSGKTSSSESSASGSKSSSDSSSNNSSSTSGSTSTKSGSSSSSGSGSSS